MTPLTNLPRLLAALLACTIAAAHHIHILDAPSGPAPPSASAPSSVSPQAARLIFASRLGLGAHFAVGDGIDDAGLAAIGALGGFPARPLLAAASRPGQRQRGMVVVQGVVKAEDVLPRERKGWRGFDVGPVPHPELAEELLVELDGAMMEEARGETEGVGRIDLSGPREGWVRRFNGRSITYSTSLQHAEKEFGHGSPQYLQEAAIVRHAIEEAVKHSDFESLTVVLLPPEHLCAKRSDSSASWGVVPKAQAKRSHEKRQAPVNEQQQLAPAQSLPYRYPSLADCQRSTSNCTGHGHCRLVYSEQGSNERQFDFYGCVCDIPEVERYKDGSVRTTTRFGGAACQKVDISVPFWILLSVTVFLILVVYMAIYMLYSMGSEELPSVIGAGVTGPRGK